MYKIKYLIMLILCVISNLSFADNQHNYEDKKIYTLKDIFSDENKFNNKEIYIIGKFRIQFEGDSFSGTNLNCLFEKNYDKNGKDRYVYFNIYPDISKYKGKSLDSYIIKTYKKNEILKNKYNDKCVIIKAKYSNKNSAIVKTGTIFFLDLIGIIEK